MEVFYEYLKWKWVISKTIKPFLNSVELSNCWIFPIRKEVIEVLGNRFDWRGVPSDRVVYQPLFTKKLIKIYNIFSLIMSSWKPFNLNQRSCSFNGAMFKLLCMFIGFIRFFSSETWLLSSFTHGMLTYKL